MQKFTDFSNLRLLIVEDDSEARSLLVQMLRDVAAEVDSAADGPGAIHKLKQSVYDVLLTDLRLPGLKGEEVVCQARSLYPDLVIIVITGYADVGSAVNVMKLGASDYIQKPFFREELMLRLKKAL